MVSTIPAIPGSVNTAPIEESTPNMKKILAKSRLRRSKQASKQVSTL